MTHRRLLSIVLALLAAPVWSETPRAPTPSAKPHHLDEATARRHILVTLPQKPSRRLLSAGSTPRGYGAKAGYKTSARVKRMVGRLAKAYGLRTVDEWPIKALDVHCVVFELPGDRSIAEILALLARDPRVESAQQMGLFRVLAQRYDDPYFGLQHGIQSMQIEQAHLWARGEGVEIAVIDTGVDLTHPELEERIVDAEDFVDERSPSFTGDIHGTAVAGVIASTANNGIGIIGVAPAAKVLALKACWPQQNRSVAALCSSFTLAKAISFAILQRPDIVNHSLAGPPDALLSRLLSRASELGIIVISAADPAAPEGPGLRLNAPGDEILTTMPFGAYDFLSGSSLAAAHVSGLVALLLEHDRELSADQILAILRDTGGTSAQGVNGCLALARVRGSGSCPGPALAARRENSGPPRLRPASSGRGSAAVQGKIPSPW